MNYYILVDREPVATDDLALWNAGMPIDRRRVALTEIGDGVNVSTVFFGMDHGFGGTPLLFETMVFGREDGPDCWRYSTWAAAEAGHERVVAALHDGTPLGELDLPIGGAA